MEAIAKASDCRSSFDELSACQNNTSGDIELAAIVRERCEKTFLSTLRSDRRRAYETAQRTCDRKYANMSGTMYASANSICKVAAAVRFAK